MKTVLFLCVMALGGCNSTPLPEYNYRGVLPDKSDVSVAVAMDFATRLATEAGLRVVDQTKPTGNANIDATFSVDLRPQSTDNVFVTIMVNMPTRTLFVRVGGAIESETAKRIAQKAEELYTRTYPGSKLTAYRRYQGLFGP